MKFTASFDMDNAAFEDMPAHETARILRNLANRIESDAINGTSLAVYAIRDINGNCIGQAKTEEA